MTIFGDFQTKRVELLVLRGTLGSSLAVSLEILAAANRLMAVRGRKPLFEAALVGSGLSVARALVPVGLPLSEAKDCAAELLVVPGLGLASEEEIDARLGERDAALLADRLVSASERGAQLAASCSAVFLLAHAGLLDGRKVTTSWWLAPLLARRYPALRLDAEALIVRDGTVTTAGAAFAQADLMLHLVSRYAGADVASSCARYLLLDARGSQSRYMALSLLAAADPLVARAERYARKHLAEGVSVGQLATAAGLGERTFSRRLQRATGLSPVRFLQQLKVEQAQELLATTKLSIELVAERVGYREPSTLRRLLRRQRVCSPSDLRTD